MSGIIVLFGKKVARRPLVSYLLPFILGLVVFVVILVTQGPDLLTFFQLDILTIPFMISGITMRLLSGIGIMLTYASVSTLIFNLTSEFVRGNERRAAVLKGLVAIIGVAIAGYAIYRIYGILYLDADLSPLEDLIALYGIWSLMLLVYVVPAIRNAYVPEYQKSSLEMKKALLSNAKFSIWKTYQRRVWGEYGKIEAREFEKYGETLAIWRSQLSGLLLLPLCFVLIPLPPLALVAFVLWLRTLSLHEAHLRDSERVLLVLITVAIIVFRTLMYFHLEVPTMTLYFDLGYSVGIVASIMAFVYLVTRS